jgi:hypothetical protein
MGMRTMASALASWGEAFQSLEAGEHHVLRYEYMLMLTLHTLTKSPSESSVKVGWDAPSQEQSIVRVSIDTLSRVCGSTHLFLCRCHLQHPFAPRLTIPTILSPAPGYHPQSPLGKNRHPCRDHIHTNQRCILVSILHSMGGLTTCTHLCQVFMTVTLAPLTVNSLCSLTGGWMVYPWAVTGPCIHPRFKGTA